MKVELLGHYGSDDVHAQSAWTSTSRDLTEELKLLETALTEFILKLSLERTSERTLAISEDCCGLFVKIR